MNELEKALTGDSAAAPPDHILEGLSDELVYREIPGAPHTIYEEVWHLVFWQQTTLLWIDGIAAPYPEHAVDGFPTKTDIEQEGWDELSRRFLQGTQAAAAVARDTGRLEQSIRCPSQPGRPMRSMTVREQLESLAAHNAYHLGRIVLLRQLNGAWPSASGGDTW